MKPDVDKAELIFLRSESLSDPMAQANNQMSIPIVMSPIIATM